MNSILILGRHDPSFSQAFARAFESYLFIDGQKVYIKGSDFKNIIVTHCVDTNIAFDFIVLKDSAFGFIPPSLYTPDTLFVFESDNLSAIEFLKHTQNSCVCYGFSERDSVTFSSVEDDSMTVCIQRAIRHNGKSLDIQEFNIEKTARTNTFACVSGAVLTRLTI